MAERDHFETFVACESIEYLRSNARKGPFFLVASFLKPHQPFMPAARAWVAYNARRESSTAAPRTAFPQRSVGLGDHTNGGGSGEIYLALAQQFGLSCAQATDTEPKAVNVN
jgi:hypothetical protein